MGPYFWTQMPLRHGVIGFKVERFFRIQAYASAKNGKIIVDGSSVFASSTRRRKPQRLALEPLKPA
jgi:hypothetical protein